MKLKTYSLRGQVVNPSGTGISDLNVQAYDANLIGKDDSIGFSTTSPNGYFEINFSSEDFSEKFLVFNFDKNPDIFFKIYKDGKVVRDTRGEAKWNDKNLEEFIKIIVDVNFPVSLGPTSIKPNYLSRLSAMFPFVKSIKNIVVLSFPQYCGTSCD